MCRIEASVRILDPKVRKTIMDILDIYEYNNVLSRVMESDGIYRRLYPDLNERAIDSQEEQFYYFNKKRKTWSSDENPCIKNSQENTLFRIKNI